MRHSKIAATHNDCAGMLRNSLKKQRYVFWKMLPVGIKRNHVACAKPCGLCRASPQGSPQKENVVRQARLPLSRDLRGLRDGICQGLRAMRVKMKIPVITSTVPAATHAVKGSPRIHTPMRMVDKGPTMPV